MKKEPRAIPVCVRMSPRFKLWLSKEQRRQNRTIREVLDTLALNYVLSRASSRKPSPVTDWPEDL